MSIGEPGSEMQKEFERDQGLADKYLAESDSKNLYALYQKRCKQLSEFGGVMCTMAELYAGKGHAALNEQDSPNAISAMERVALAAIELAHSISCKN